MREAHAECCLSPRVLTPRRVRGGESYQDRLLIELGVKEKQEVTDENEVRSSSQKEDRRKIIDT